VFTDPATEIILPFGLPLLLGIYWWCHVLQATSTTRLSL
jgi:hypothetical protein